MSEWKERAIKKKDYRRGGLEPDPPKRRRSIKQHKPFKLQYKWSFSKNWSTQGKYKTFDIALEVARKDVQKWLGRVYTSNEYIPYRIINTDTGEIITYTSIESLMKD